MSTNYQLIVPSYAETAATGFLLGAKKTIRNQDWEIRLNVVANEIKACVTKNGETIPNPSFTDKAVLNFWNAFISFYSSTRKV